ncbi:MAG: efflux RND transporter periplasmic adaptor subunit [Pirellulaceae bacterium]
MKFLAYAILVFVVLGGVAAAAYKPVRQYMENRNKPKWKTEAVEEGTIVFVINSTGEVKPVQSVQIGSFVSGPIKEIFVDFNDEVKAGEVLAKVDPRLVDATVRADTAALNSRRAEVNRVKALLSQARRNEQRAKRLWEENPDYISQTELDQYTFNAQSLEAELAVVQAAVEQAQAALDNATANLNYTEIVAPIDGVIIDRKIDPGQTLAASFQTPELFVLAPDMDKKMHIFASVDEADIGYIMKAQQNNQRVQFTVDAWPGEVFDGQIEQIRVSATTTQNVVTYPVVVAAPNPERKLLPGMTANLSFDVERRESALKIPNTAMRFFPEKKYVREQDHPILEGRANDNSDDDDVAIELSAAEKAAAKLRQKTRHVWVVEGDKLKAVEIDIGISDNKFSELVKGDLKAGDKLITGIEAAGKK